MIARMRCESCFTYRLAAETSQGKQVKLRWRREALGGVESKRGVEGYIAKAVGFRGFIHLLLRSL